MDAIVIPPGHGHRVGNVEFLARTADTPRFTFGIIELAPGRVLEAHVHAEEDDAFYILEGELTFALASGDVPCAAGDLRPRPAGGGARLPQRRQDRRADAQPPRPGGVRPTDRSGGLTRRRSR